MKRQVLVTGGAGYIGSHAVVELLDKGYSVVVVDNLENGFFEYVDKRAKFYQADIRDKDTLNRIFKENEISVVLHFAGYIKVPESIEDPAKYYNNNVYGTLCLLETMKENHVKRIVFSSTAAVYGNVESDEKVDEKHPKRPINPYGKSKLMAENIILDFAKAYNFNYSIFRYFNVAGAHEKYLIGQTGKGVTALVTLTLKAIKYNRVLNVFGNDYPTKDGTGVRDYIHVVDLVNAHILSIKMLEGSENGIFNLGNENGFSVLEIIKAVEEITKQKVRYEVISRRKGDPAMVVASSKKAKEILKWQPKYTNILDIVRTSWEFMNKK